MENASSVTSGRRKTRIACESCKRMKRKCNGRLPCNSCVRYDYKCAYGDRSSASDHHPSPPTDLQKDQRHVTFSRPASRSGDTIEPSTAPFAHDLLKRLNNDEDTNAVATKMRDDSWNIGLRPVAIEPSSLLNLVTLAAVNEYASVYFSKINPVYEFIDHTQFTPYLNRALKKDDPLRAPCAAVVCYITALGSLFSGTTVAGLSNSSRAESEIVAYGHTQLERSRINSQSDSVVIAALGWLLRALYARMAADRHSAWFASFSALTLLEGVQKHTDDASEQVTVNCCHFDHFDHAKLHRLARLLNLWIANELDSVLRRGIVPSLPCTLSSIETIPRTPSALLSLYEISICLCALRKPPSLPILIDILSDLDHQSSLKPLHDVLQLHISNHALCTYRIMRQTKSIVPNTTATTIIRLATPGVAAALRLARDQQPWWHVVHMPFQFLCLLLSMDTRESLAQISSVLASLRTIHAALPTRNMADVVSTAEALVGMCRRNKIEEASVLDGGGGRATSGFVGEMVQQQQQQQQPIVHGQNVSEASLVAGGVGGDVGGYDLQSASLDSSDFDWDAFMQNCMPLYEDGFPSLP